MSRRVDISAFKYAVISVNGFRNEIVALSVDKYSAHRVASSGLYVVETKELEAFKVSAYVGRDHASHSYIGYGAVDSNTRLEDKFITGA